MKKLLVTLMCIIMVVAMVPTMAFAATEVADETAFRNAVAAGGEITLTGDITLTSAITIDKDTILNLNGHKLTTADHTNYGILVKDDFTINGEGDVVIGGLYGIGVSTSSVGVLTINGGNFVQTASGYMIGNWGEVVINGGTFTAA